MAEAKTQSLKSAVLDSVPGIQHGFGVRAEPLPLVFSATWEARRWRGKQVHGTQAVELREPGQDAGETDAVMTWELGIPAAVQTADCVPVLLARQDGRAVAAVHAGWRGARARILARLWEKLHLRGEEPRPALRVEERRVERREDLRAMFLLGDRDLFLREPPLTSGGGLTPGGMGAKNLYPSSVKSLGTAGGGQLIGVPSALRVLTPLPIAQGPGKGGCEKGSVGILAATPLEFTPLNCVYVCCARVCISGSVSVLANKADPRLKS